MRVIFNQQYEPLFVVWEDIYKEMLERKVVNTDQVLIT